jgi:hypothetical protein
LYPAVVFSVGFFLNFFIWGKRSSGAVPFSTMLAILVMWLGISFPLVCLGFYFGYRKQVNIKRKDDYENKSMVFSSLMINQFEQIKFHVKCPNNNGFYIQY